MLNDVTGQFGGNILRHSTTTLMICQTSPVFDILPLDEAVASRDVFVIVSGSDGRAGGRKRLWCQLNNSKTVKKIDYMCQRGANRNTWASYWMTPSLTDNPQPRGSKVSIWNCSQTVRDRPNGSIPSRQTGGQKVPLSNFNRPVGSWRKRQ